MKRPQKRGGFILKTYFKQVDGRVKVVLGVSLEHWFDIWIVNKLFIRLGE